MKIKKHQSEFQYYPMFTITKLFPPLLQSIESLIMDWFWHSRCLNDLIDLLYMIGSFASGANASLVAKIGNKDLATSCWVYRISNNGRILMFKVSKQPYRSPLHDRIICKWPQIKKFHKTHPPQKWDFWFKIKFQNFQKPKSNSKKAPKVPKNKKYL